MKIAILFHTDLHGQFNNQSVAYARTRLNVLGSLAVSIMTIVPFGTLALLSPRLRSIGSFWS